MTIPPILNDILQLLIGAAVPAAICALLLAGIALRQEGGLNFEAGGKFQRWILWSAIFLTLPGILAWFASRGVNVPAGTSGGVTSPWLGSIAGTFDAFVSQIVVARLVPITASFFVLKAALDAAHGHSPLGSVVAAIFLLSIPGTIQLLKSWNTGSAFATTDLLSSLWNYLAGTILPDRSLDREAQSLCQRRLARSSKLSFSCFHGAWAEISSVLLGYGGYPSPEGLVVTVLQLRLAACTVEAPAC